MICKVDASTDPVLCQFSDQLEFASNELNVYSHVSFFFPADDLAQTALCTHSDFDVFVPFFQ